MQNGTKKGYNINDEDAIAYYKEAYEFTKWFNDTVLRDFGTTTHAYEQLYISADNSPLQGASSNFNDEKTEVIKDSITNNLIQAMNVYGKFASKDFRAPELNSVDWDTILNNICVISFMQGIPVGTSIFNDYAIITSTDNSKYVNENTLYFIGSDDPNTYHRIGCEKLSGDITGYNKAEFKRKQLEEDGTVSYEYTRRENACYYCMVRASESNLLKIEEDAKSNDKLYEWYKNTAERRRRETAYYTALAKEKHKLVKISDYINNSDKLTK